MELYTAIVKGIENIYSIIYCFFYKTHIDIRPENKKLFAVDIVDKVLKSKACEKIQNYTNKNFRVSEKLSVKLIFSGISLIVIFFISFLYLGVEDNKEKEALGQFGDVVGGLVGSIWALAGVVLFYTGLKDQKEDIKLNRDALKKQVEALNFQKDELSLQTKEFRNTVSVYKEQARTLKKQQFESNFYSLLSICEKSKQEIIKLSEDKGFYRELNEKVRTNTSLCVNSAYLEFYFNNRECMSKYFRLIYRVIKTIDDSTLDFEDKVHYSKVLRSTLSEAELLILYYNAHSPHGRELYPLILKYNLIKHLSPMEKIEFDGFKSKEASLEVDKRLFLEWFDKILLSFMPSAYDYDNDLISQKYECVHISNCIFSLSVDEDDRILVEFDIPEEMDNVFGLSIESLNDMILCYLKDRLFYSCFRSIDDSDLINEKSEGNCFRYVIISNKDLALTEEPSGENKK